MKEKRWYDVHFSYNGYYTINAASPEEAEQIVEQILEDKLLEVEKVVHTGLGPEIYEVVESAVQED